MKFFTLIFPLALCGALAAADADANAAQIAPQRNLVAVHAEQAAIQAHAARGARTLHATRSATAERALGQGMGGENGPYPNPYRAYPPSCMADPLPSQPSGPTYSRTIDLAAYAPDSKQYLRQPTTVTFWRVPCSSSGTPHAITLMRLTIIPNETYTASNAYLLFPGLRVAQGAVGFDDPNGQDFARVALEPNTIISDVIAESPLVYSTTFVLENYPIAGQTTFDFNQPFKVRLDNFFTSGTAQYVFDIPAYAPTADTYPTAFQPLPINGYLSSAYYTPTHSGEGALVDVFEDPVHNDYVLQIFWFTYGPDGRPVWLAGGATVEPGTRSLVVPMNYLDNGGFAGDFGAGADRHSWGTLTLAFPDCRHMNFSYAATTGLPDWVPQGSGGRKWTRLSNVNGLTCE